MEFEFMSMELCFSWRIRLTMRSIGFGGQTRWVRPFPSHVLLPDYSFLLPCADGLSHLLGFISAKTHTHLHPSNAVLNNGYPLAGITHKRKVLLIFVSQDSPMAKKTITEAVVPDSQIWFCFFREALSSQLFQDSLSLEVSSSSDGLSTASLLQFKLRFSPDKFICVKHPFGSDFSIFWDFLVLKAVRMCGFLPVQRISCYFFSQNGLLADSGASTSIGEWMHSFIRITRLKTSYNKGALYKKMICCLFS